MIKFCFNILFDFISMFSLIIMEALILYEIMNIPVFIVKYMMLLSILLLLIRNASFHLMFPQI